MPGISFSGEPKNGPFWWQIITRQKIQTCRIPRKRPFNLDDRLMLYWKMRVSKDKKPIHHLGDAKAVGVPIRFYGEFAYVDEFARRDGFANSEELRQWFGDPFDWGGKGEVVRSLLHFTTKYQVIIWEQTLVLSVEADTIIEKCKDHPAYPDYKAYTETYGIEA